MLGVSPEQTVSVLSSMGASTISGNCGKGPNKLILAIEEMHRTLPDAIPVAKTNVEIPEVVDGEMIYEMKQPTMEECALLTHDAGARIMGECQCSTLANVTAISKAF